jgi:hypothetical protein
LHPMTSPSFETGPADAYPLLDFVEIAMVRN